MTTMTQSFEPGEVRYIKLGDGGRWAPGAVESGIIPFGYRDVDHGLCEAGDWDAVRAQLIAAGWTAQGSGNGVREIRDFYCLGDDTLWVTIADGHLWWAFSAGPVIPAACAGPGDPSRLRRTRDGWHRESLTGEALTTRSLSSALTRTASYRMTICKVERKDYLLRRIRGEAEPLHEEATTLKVQMADIALRMIQQLHWQEFETLVDLIFARGGWRRSSVLGKNEANVDLIVDQPVTGETAWVQVKTGTDQGDLEDYLERFRRDGSCDRFFFVCHSPRGTLRLADDPRHHLWTSVTLADAAISAGLYDWLIDRTR